MNRFIIFTLIISAALLPPSLSFAAGDVENTEYAYGTVVSIDLQTNIVVIKEQNYDTDTESDVTYYLSPDTAFENIKSLNEIVAGNDVDISYLAGEGGKKTVKFISVYKPELEDEGE